MKLGFVIQLLKFRLSNTGLIIFLGEKVIVNKHRLALTWFQCEQDFAILLEKDTVQLKVLHSLIHIVPTKIFSTN